MPSLLNTKLALTGGVLAGIGGSACCVGPLLLLSMGIGGRLDWSTDRSRTVPPNLHRADGCIPRRRFLEAVSRSSELHSGR